MSPRCIRTRKGSPPARAPLVASSLVHLDVAPDERLHAGVVAGAQAEAIRVRTSTWFPVVGYVDPEVDGSGSIDPRRAEDARRLPVGAASHGENLDRMDVEVRGSSVIAVLLLALRASRRDHRVAAERRLVTVGRLDRAADDKATFGGNAMVPAN